MRKQNVYCLSVVVATGLTGPRLSPVFSWCIITFIIRQKLTYQQTKVHVRGVKSEADDGGFSQDLDLVRGASFYVALGHHFLSGVFLSVERHRDLLLLPRLEMATVRHHIKHLQTERPRFS